MCSVRSLGRPWMAWAWPSDAPTVIAAELREGRLVPVFESQSETRSSCGPISTSPARQKPEISAFRGWFLAMAANERMVTAP